MAALNFVAADDGLEDDPKLLTLARLLKVSRPMAFWFVMRWQRLILDRGNHVSGSLPRNYTADDIAAYLEFKGGARRLIEAMKMQGYLSFKKGRGFFYPAWDDTTTGRYAHRREEDRIWHEDKRKQQRRSSAVRPSSDVVRQSADTSADGLTTSSRQPTGRKEESSGERPPDPPPAGGASLADTRWDWLERAAPTPQNRSACKRVLEAMTTEDWALVQRAYGLLHDPGASISRKNRRVLSWPTDLFLAKQGFLRFRPPARPTRTPVTRSPIPPEPDPLVELGKPQEWREAWLADPINKGRLPPWYSASDHQNGTSGCPPPAQPPVAPRGSK